MHGCARNGLPPALHACRRRHDAHKVPGPATALFATEHLPRQSHWLRKAGSSPNPFRATGIPTVEKRNASAVRQSMRPRPGVGRRRSRVRSAAPPAATISVPGARATAPETGGHHECAGGAAAAGRRGARCPDRSSASPMHTGNPAATRDGRCGDRPGATLGHAASVSGRPSGGRYDGTLSPNARAPLSEKMGGDTSRATLPQQNGT
jgi:hypothetical protein